MKYALGITLFNPSNDQLNRIYSYVEHFDIIFVYDNSKERIINNFNTKKIIYLHNGKNDGLCKAFNFIIKKCFENNIRFLCTLDQDSYLSKDSITGIKSFIEKKNDRIAIVAPRIIYAHKQDKKFNSEKVIFKNWVICAGSFIDLQIIQNEGMKYDEYYFLDRFDQDLCTEFRKKNYKIAQLNDNVLYQELGYKKNNFSNHSALRHYFIARNRLYYNNKNFKGFKTIVKTVLQSLYHIYQVIFYEDNKVKKIIAIKSGIEDYIKYKKSL